MRMWLKSLLLVLVSVAYAKAWGTYSVDYPFYRIDHISYDIEKKTGAYFTSECSANYDPNNVTFCTVHKTYYYYDNGNKQNEESCSFNVKVQSIMKNHFFKSLNENTVIMSFGEVWGANRTGATPGFKIRVLQMSDCSHQDFEISDAYRGYLVTDQLAPQTFGVVHQSCSTCELGENIFWSVYNVSSGQKISGPEPISIRGLDDKSLYSQPILLRSPKEAYYLRQVTLEKDTLYRVDSSGKAVKLVESSQSRLAISSDQSVLSVCLHNGKIVCSQYDSEGKARPYAEIEGVLTNSSRKVWLDTFNLPHNRMMLFGGYVERSTEDLPQNLRLVEDVAVQIDASGKHGPVVELLGPSFFECAAFALPDLSSAKTNFVEDKDDKDYYCFNFMCTNYSNPKTGEVIKSIRCFKKQEFTDNVSK